VAEKRAAGTGHQQAAGAVGRIRQAGRRDPGRRPQRPRSKRVLPRAWALSQAACPLAPGGRGCEWPQRADHDQPQGSTAKTQEQARKIRRLERELQKMEKALSEAAILLMLS
jgi:hypothetical protein